MTPRPTAQAVPDQADRSPADRSPTDRSPADRFTRAADLIATGQHAAAEAILRDLLAESPADAEILHSLGLLCLATNRAAEACTLLTQAAAAAPHVAAIATKLGLALTHLGRRTEALAALDHAIALDPAQAEAHDTRGTVLLAEGQSEAALAAYDTAVALRPDFAEAVANRGSALLRLGRPMPALDAFTAAIALNPALPDAHLNRAIALSHLARHAEALVEVDQALKLAPVHAEASNMRGIVLMAMHRLPEALSAFARAVALRPDFADALFNQATVLTTLDHHADAVASFDRVLAFRPGHADALLNRGNALLGLGRVEDGLASYRAAQARVPDHKEININIGNALQRLDRHADALAAYDAAIVLAPDQSVPYNNRGNALIALHRPHDALAAYDRAVALDPTYADAHYNRANALLQLDRLDAALDAYHRSLALRTDFPEALLNHGAALQRHARHAEALTDFARVQLLRPDFADAHWNESLSRLALGDYSAGWRKYEWRWNSLDLSASRRDFAQPLWLGDSDLAGRTLLVHAEQGFGDTLQFCRYLPLLPQSAHIIFEVQRPLLRLMASLPRAPTLLAQGNPLPDFDLHCPLLSLPLACGTTVETIPPRVPYLAVPPALSGPWHERLAALPGLRVGICWAGDPRHHLPGANAVDRRRSTALAAWAPLAAIRGISLVSLQKGPAAEQIAQPPDGMVLHDWTMDLDDFADTAAVIAALDLVITVDTATAHLAGALAKPVWILNRYDQCWRWLTGRTTSPWYPTATLFRQPAPGDWPPVFAAVADALREVLMIPRAAACCPTDPRHHRAQRVSHRGDHAVPIARPRLMKQPCGGIPGRVRANQQPPPARIETIEHPHRLAQRAGQMRDSGVDRDHQVQRLDQRRGIGKVLQILRPVSDRQPRRRAAGLRRRLTLL